MPVDRTEKGTSPLQFVPKSVFANKMPKTQAKVSRVLINDDKAKKNASTAHSLATPVPTKGDQNMDRPRSASPAMSVVTSSAVMSGFSSDDEEWPTSVFGEVGGLGGSNSAPPLSSVAARSVDHATDMTFDTTTFLTPAHLLDQIKLVQSQLLSFSLALGTGSVEPDPARQSSASQVDQLHKDAAFLRQENETLKETNYNLRQNAKALEARLKTMTAELNQAKRNSFEPDPCETVRASIGIDPEEICGLAIDLTTGVRSRNDVADALWALAEKANPYPGGPDELKREKLAPRDRLRNVEGVVDVTLGRVEEIEKKLGLIRELRMEREAKRVFSEGNGVGVFEGVVIKDMEVDGEEEEEVQLENSW